MRTSTIAAVGASLLAMTAFQTAQAQSVDDALQALPEVLRANYDNTTSTVALPALGNFTAPDGPWRWCHSESFQGNPWRVALTDELRRLVDGLIAEGVVSSFEMTDSNGDASLQISHIRSFVDRGCDVITSIPGSTTGLNAAVDAAVDAGVPYITGASAVSSEKAINVDSNYWRWGYDMARRLSEEIGGSGSVLMVEGIAGYSITDQEREGALAGFDEFPDVKVVRRVNGDWTPSVTKSVVLQTLATNPAAIDGVWTAGSESRVVAEAFDQAGRDQPVITGSITGDALGYWKANPDDFKFTGHALLPQWIAQSIFRVTTRIMDGQQPVLSTLMIPIPPVELSDFDGWYASCMQPESSEIFPTPPVEPVPVDYLNAYFNNDTPAPGYDFAQVPPACG